MPRIHNDVRGVNLKNKRIPLIRQLIKDHVVQTQIELQHLLQEAGVVTTQATLSRDIKSLGVVKRLDENNVLRYYLLEDQVSSPVVISRIGRLLRDAMVSLHIAQNMVVLKTLPGHAHAVGSLFDHIGWRELIATIAGDDTLLLITGDNEAALKLEERISAVLE